MGRGGSFFVASSGNQFQGNLVGTAADGISPIPNAYHNLELESGCYDNQVGVPGVGGNCFAYAPTLYAGIRVRRGVFIIKFAATGSS